MSLVSPRQFLDHQGRLQPGYTEYRVVDNVLGKVSKEYSYSFSNGEEYKTHKIEDHLKAYTVTIRTILGSGRSSEVQSSSSKADAGAGALVKAGEAASAGLEAQAHYSKEAKESCSRNSTMQKIFFKVTGGVDKSFFKGNDSPTALSIFVYTFSPEKAREQATLQSLSPEGAATSSLAPKVCAEIPIQAFGPAQWSEYFGVVVDETALPGSLQKELLSSPDRYTLVLIPSDVYLKKEKVPLDFALGVSLLAAQRLKGYPFAVSKTSLFPVQPVDSSRWVLLTKQCFPETVSHGQKSPTSDQEQKQIVQKHYSSYRVPAAWEAFLAIALHKIHTGEVLYGKRPDGKGSHWMRCAKENGASPLVGGHDERGLRIKPQQDMLEKASNIGTAGIFR